MSGVLHGVVASLKAAAAAATDTFFRYVSLLLNTTSTNGAQNNTFLDASTNNFTITRNGNTTQGAFTPYMPNGYWGAYFDGTGDNLKAPAGSAFAYGTGDFTVEGWFNCPSLPSYFANVFAQTVSGANYFICALGDGVNITPAKKICFIFATSGSGTTVLSGSTEFQLNTWNHFAIVRSSGSVTCYLNGVGGTPVSCAQDFNNTTYVPTVGTYSHTQSEQFTGYLSNLRVVKGTAVYTANFTPSTTPLTAITNTSLLACQSNRFIDNSTNAFAITVNGDSRISKFSPFSPPASYSTATYGGSGYFDGAGDYLSVPRNNAFLPVANEDFTFEAWIYLTATPGATGSTVMAMGEWGASSDWFFYLDSSRQIILYQASTITGFTNTNTPVALNTWTHIAVSRSGTSANNLTIYVNGVGQSFSTNATMVGAGLFNLSIGADQNGDESNFTGYISNARIVKGTAVYTANFTPPSTPLTAITNTSLLLDFTNGGIYDAATINDLETSGSAQVSTTQAKFGTTSAKFAGGSDWMQMVNNPSLRFGTAPFTIEAWLYPTSTSSMCVVSVYTGSSGWTWKISGNVIAWYDNTSGNIGGTASVASNTWTHVAIVREGTGTNQFKFYVNGVLDVTSTCSANFTQTANCFVGGEGTATPNFATNVWNGYIDELRITNGYARYTSNFTPPTAAFPTQ